MTGKIEYDISQPLERKAFMVAANADNLCLVIWRAREYAIDKMNHGKPSERKVWEAVVARINEDMEDLGVNEDWLS